MCELRFPENESGFKRLDKYLIWQNAFRRPYTQRVSHLNQGIKSGQLPIMLYLYDFVRAASSGPFVENAFHTSDTDEAIPQYVSIDESTELTNPLWTRIVGFEGV